MKEVELRKHAVCSRCGKKIGHTGILSFWTVNVTGYAIKEESLRRSTGLAMFLGSAELAMVMGENDDMTEEFVNKTITLCEACALPIKCLLDSCETDDAPKVEKLTRSKS